MGKTVTRISRGEEFELDEEALDEADDALNSVLKKPTRAARERFVISLVALILEPDESEPDAGDE